MEHNDVDDAAFRAVLHKYANVNACLTAQEVAEAIVAGHVVVDHLEYLRLTTLADNRRAVAMSMYMSDGWGSFINSTKVGHVGDYHVIRNGKTRKEFLLERSVLKVLTGGETKVHMMFYPPISLENGKKAWNVFTAACESGPTLRHSGHIGIAISAYLFDGMLFQALSRHLQARHSIAYDSGICDVQFDGEEVVLLMLTDWCIAIKCCLHSCSNSVKWGLTPLRAGIEHDDVHISIAACQKSQSELHAHIDKFLLATLTFSDVPSGTVAEREMFWKALEVEANVLDDLVYVDPFWDGTSLLVNKQLMHVENGWEQIASCVLYLLQWIMYSETRWAKVGRSARLLLRSLAIGLDGLVDIVKHDPNASMYHLNGFFRATPGIRRYIAIAAASTFPVEALAIELFDDDRVLRRVAELRGVLDEEYHYILSLPSYYWARVAKLVSGSCDATELRCATLRATNAMLGYLHHDMFAQLERHPLSLTQGSIAENLSALAEQALDDVKEPTAKKIRQLLALQFPTDRLCVALGFVRDELSCTTNLVEQGHGSGACLRKYHDTYNERTLRWRCLHHQCRALLNDSKDERVSRALRNHIADLEGYAPSIGGRQMFFKVMLNNKMNAVDGDGGDARKRARRIMSDHAAAYEQLPKRERAAYDLKARKYVEYKKEETRGDIVHLRARLELHERRCLEESRELGMRSHVNEVRFTDLDIKIMAESMRKISSDRKGNKQRLLNEELESPAAPTQAEQNILLAEEKKLGVPIELKQPRWVRHIAAHRDLFVDVAICKDSDAGAAYLVVNALQNPCTVSFLELRKMERATVLHDDSIFGELDLQPLHHREYSYLPFKHTTGDLIPINEEDDDLIVIPGVTMLNDVASTNQPPQFWEQFTFHHSQPIRSSSNIGKRERAHVSKSEMARLLQEHPWLTEHDFVRASGRGVGGGGSSSSNKVAKKSAPEDTGKLAETQELFEVDMEELKCEILQLREDCGDEEDEYTFFYTRLLCGPWTKAHKGVAAQGIVGLARAGLPKQWCKDYGFPSQFNAFFARYGNNSAVQLAREYCRRADHYFKIWLEDPTYNQKFRYNDAHIASYTETTEWFDFALAQPLNSATFGRVMEVRRLVPKHSSGAKNQNAKR